MIKLSTFSITARCTQTGQFGVAVSTAIPAVGMLCPFARAGAGAVASQSYVNPYLGIWGLELLEKGRSAQEVLEEVLARDPDSAKRQLAVVDRHGNAAAHTGEASDTWRGHLTAPNVAVAGNMLTGEATLQAMMARFSETESRPFSERLLEALQAGQHAGGDKRGRQSAALYVVSTEAYPYLDLRVDEHTDPVSELRRVFGVANEVLVPFLPMLPTKANPGGVYDLDEARWLGVLKDGG